ncbi:hypothetical protein ICE98_01973 [Lactococcus lactis]|nr:hypothetical protein [Lactococcus lactis]
MARIALTRDKIVQATIKLAGKIGLSNVSFPRLAEYFGIKAPSLYNHFKNMEEVRVATAVYLQKELNHELTHAMVGLTPLAALRAYAESYKRFAEKYEAVYELINVIHQTNNGELEYLAKEIFVWFVEAWKIFICQKKKIFISVGCFAQLCTALYFNTVRIFPSVWINF